MATRPRRPSAREGVAGSGVARAETAPRKRTPWLARIQRGVHKAHRLFLHNAIVRGAGMGFGGLFSSQEEGVGSWRARLGWAGKGFGRWSWGAACAVLEPDAVIEMEEVFALEASRAVQCFSYCETHCGRRAWLSGR